MEKLITIEQPVYFGDVIRLTNQNGDTYCTVDEEVIVFFSELDDTDSITDLINALQTFINIYYTGATREEFNQARIQAEQVIKNINK